jgi:cytochrome c oxidase subunit 2
VRRASIVQLIVIGAIAGVIACAIAVLLPWLPEPASREAGRIDFVFWFTAAICILIFSLVAAVIVYAVWRYRVAPDDDSDGPPVHGHTMLEIVWTAIPAAMVTSIAIVSAIVLSKNDAQGANPLIVRVHARQFTWSFAYPGSKREYPVLRLPVNRSVLLRMRSDDVIHSFWVPQFGQKQDVVPGIVTKLHITPTRVGTYVVECTELCGVGHAIMRSKTIVMTRSKFDRWLAAQTK